MEPLNVCSGVAEINGDMDSKEDSEGAGLFDNVGIVE
jgi:hypothetical protein